VDAARAVTSVHEATTTLAESLLPVLRSLDAHGVLTAQGARDPGQALVLGQVRSCVASGHEVVAHVLTIEHLLDERHVVTLTSQRPVVTASSLSVVTARDAWVRAAEALAYGSSYANAALPALRAAGDPLADPVAAVVAATDDLADALTALEPFLTVGVDPSTVPRPRSAPPTTQVLPGRRQPRWGPAA